MFILCSLIFTVEYFLLLYTIYIFECTRKFQITITAVFDHIFRMHNLVRRHHADLDAVRKTSRHSDESYESHESRSTAPTSVGSPRPSIAHAYTTGPKMERQEYHMQTAQITELVPRDSSETYTSTLASREEQDLFDEPLEYNMPEYHRESLGTTVRPSSPQDFADYFPSTRCLFIRHDDSTIDGNMNLRVDTDAGSPAAKESIQLFHMRMHDLKSREFSLRRYSRDSGREVCHSSRRYTKPASLQRPSLQRSVSNALASLHIKSDIKRTDSMLSSVSNPQRQDSGYGSGSSSSLSTTSSSSSSDNNTHLNSPGPDKVSLPLPTNTTKLEFSNYAQIDVKRRGTKAAKHYDFEYWGHTYRWRRCAEKGAGDASFHLVRGDGPVIAQIVPELLSACQTRYEKEAGGWVPPCRMWISDQNVLGGLTDVAEYVLFHFCLCCLFSPFFSLYTFPIPFLYLHSQRCRWKYHLSCDLFFFLSFFPLAVGLVSTSYFFRF